ncbi:TVP38/TMEM64 family protein [Bacillus sp. B15-48]|uniref:TVP38/TMEM64 family protein n=1 Tax=Bacillus sp. B15-48 TaxID=1548601 RepID=UPI00193F1436|nr:TVP38/TMEM64 family protein [Bacillus sp. B15-48]MBM4762971.1 TVP38/TMEM64 family protein [Bacillus sp. B15-48]
MKFFFQTIIHLIAALFLYFMIGMALSSWLIQSEFIDMHFDSEVLVTIALLVALWHYFARVFMNAKSLSLWEKNRAGMFAALISLALSLIIHTVNGSLSILPAYIARKGLFLGNVISLNTVNVLLILFLIIGFIALFIAQRNPLVVKSNPKMDWNKLSASSRVGMMSLFGLLGVFLAFYLGQGTVRDLVNHSVVYLKDADVEGFRDYLLSFGPLAAIVSALLMVFQSVIAPLPAFVITFANGLLFGWFYGAILSWSSAMLGAVICFYIAKFLGRPVVEKIVTKKALDWWDQFFGKYGKHSVFLARILPIVSFDLVSYAAGVTSIRFWQFFWATGLGQLPATILYSYLGQNATGTVQILFILFTVVTALAVLGVIFKPKIEAKLRAKKGANVQ